MGKRKLAQLLDSEDENEEGPVLSKEEQVGAEEEVGEEEKYVKEGEEAMAAVNVAVGSAGVNEGEKEKEKEAVEKEEDNVGDGEEEEEDDEEEEPASEPKPLGDVIKRSGRGKLEKLYYQAFELDGNRYELVRHFIAYIVMLFGTNFFQVKLWYGLVFKSFPNV